MPLDQLSGIFIVSTFIHYTNTPDFLSFFCFLFFYSVGPLTDILGSLSSIMFSSVYACPLGNASGVLSLSAPVPDQDPGGIRRLRRVSGAARQFSLKVKSKKVRQKVGERIYNSEHIFLSDRRYIAD